MKVAIENPYAVFYLTSVESSIIAVAVLEIFDAEFSAAYLWGLLPNMSSLVRVVLH